MPNRQHTEDQESLWPDDGADVRAAKPDSDERVRLIVDVDGFEGPLDLLLELSRSQKVDLSKISILALAEQYLAFIDSARKMQLDIAADYLVMAAWLAYLKSRLLLPKVEDDEEIPAEEMAQRLAFRLQRLNAMREAAAQLMARNILGRDVFARGAPEPLVVDTEVEHADNLYDLLKAYSERRQRGMTQRNLSIRKLPVWSIKEARQTLEKLIGQMDDWGRLDSWLTEYLVEPEMRPSVLASSLSASLELVREGVLEIRQETAFKPIYMRKNSGKSASGPVTG